MYAVYRNAAEFPNCGFASESGLKYALAVDLYTLNAILSNWCPAPSEEAANVCNYAGDQIRLQWSSQARKHTACHQHPVRHDPNKTKPNQSNRRKKNRTQISTPMSVACSSVSRSVVRPSVRSVRCACNYKSAKTLSLLISRLSASLRYSQASGLWATPPSIVNAIGPRRAHGGQANSARSILGT